ncbi:MAG: hypothetical protein H7Y86_15365 [Rhizobacter sp.]|nr:hypothetical protein [Ferruginibacter sp.]
MLNQSRTPDVEILEKIRNNNLKGWEELYDIYSASMLGIICKLTNDKQKGQQILVRIFTATQFGHFLNGITNSLPGRLYQYTFSHTLLLLKDEGINIDVGTIEGLPGIFKFLYKNDDGENKHSRVQLTSKQYNWLPVYGFNIYADMISYS